MLPLHPPGSFGLKFPNLTQIMPLSDWMKNWQAEQPPQKNEAIMICESLLMELDFQMHEVENNKKENEMEIRRKKNGVDYGWLMSSQPKAYEMPQLERLELEELCLKVKPEECGRVITEFRSSLDRDPTVEEIPRLMRAVILQVLEGRPKEDTMMEWMSKSLTKLRPSSNAKVAPVSIEGAGDNDVVQLREPMEDRLFERVEDLPV